MMQYIKNPTRIFFCEECQKFLKTDEYMTTDWLNYVSVCICWEVISADWHINNLYFE